MIVQRLLKLQNKYGYLPDRELTKLAEELGEPLYRIEEVSSFFPAFRRERPGEPPPGLLVRVCRDMTCHHRGAERLTAELANKDVAADLSRRLLEKRTAEVKAENQKRRAAGRPEVPPPTEADCRVVVEGVSCLGRCDRAPAAWVEMHPAPHGDHAYVYAGRGRVALLDQLGRLAEGEEPTPDTDRAYKLHTNGTKATTSPPHGRWHVDPYGRPDPPKPYEAARQAAAYVTVNNGVPRPPSDEAGKKLSEKDLDAYVESHVPLLWRLKQAGLLGMGGAGAPAYTKWRDVWREPPGEKYVVANGDESEPGTFKDRELLLRTPHLVVEGLVLAGLLTGATRAYVYIRHEYHEQIAAVEAEIQRAERLGACGPNVFGCGLAVHVEVFESPGGYICGEQSALLEAMEDRRSQPRNRPPELGTNGLRDKPTVVNNIETLSWVPSIALMGTAVPEYAESGWQVPAAEWATSPTPPRFAGRRLFSVSGDVRRPGVYEVPVGLPLGELLESSEYCGGFTGEFAALAPSGPSGGLMPAKLQLTDPKMWDRIPRALEGIAGRSKNDAGIMEWFVKKYLPQGATHLDLRAIPLDLVFWRNLDAVLRLPVEPMLGAGMVVYCGPLNALNHAVNFTRFYRNESCGKCVPCRLGSEKLVTLGTDLLAGRSKADGVMPLVREMYKVMQQTSICGLGYVAPIPLRSALEYFPERK
jgi:NADH:ubiquinone oxidoreductase subunit F (NADH-binding)/NADH:ubiquinone oxidoreductase subunit E